MFGFNKKCIICNKEIEKGAEVKKHATFFCGEECAAKYEILLEEAKNKVNLDNCC